MPGRRPAYTFGGLIKLARLLLRIGKSAVRWTDLTARQHCPHEPACQLRGREDCQRFSGPRDHKAITRMSWEGRSGKHQYGQCQPIAPITAIDRFARSFSGEVPLRYGADDFEIGSHVRSLHIVAGAS